MKYPHYLSHVRFVDNGFKLHLTDGGGMTQDVYSGASHDRFGRHVLLERHELEVLIFRETLDEKDQKPSGKFELLHSVPIGSVKLTEIEPAENIQPHAPVETAGAKARKQAAPAPAPAKPAGAK